MKFKWIRKPVLTPLNPVSVWEHTPLNPWRSEYPRFIRPPRDECRWEWAKLYDDGRIVAAGDEYLPSNASLSGCRRPSPGMTC